MKKVWLVLLALLVLLVVVAIPAVALAQTPPGVVDVGEPLTWQGLGSLVGAAAAATLIAQTMVRIWPDIKAGAVRVTMLIVAVGLAELVALRATPTLETGVVAFFVGLSAAAAAMKGYETYKHGPNAEVGTPKA